MFSNPIYAATGTFDDKPLTFEDILAAVNKLKAIPQNDQWLLVDPQGRLYKGKAEEVLPILMAQHPLFKLRRMTDIMDQSGLREPELDGDNDSTEETIMADRTLKSYEVRDDGEGYCTIAFATNSATARREGASALDTDWESIESCTRKPEFDSYAPGPVPPLTLIEHGWWFECQHCGWRVSNNMAEELEDEGLDPEDFVPQPAGQHGVFCSAACAAESAAEKRLHERAEANLLEVFEARFPDAKVLEYRAYGTRLEPKEARVRKNWVSFKYPGAQWAAVWEFGCSHVDVPHDDVPAFNAWREASKVVAP